MHVKEQLMRKIKWGPQGKKKDKDVQNLFSWRRSQTFNLKVGRSFCINQHKFWTYLQILSYNSLPSTAKLKAFSMGHGWNVLGTNRNSTAGVWSLEMDSMILFSDNMHTQNSEIKKSREKHFCVCVCSVVDVACF